MSWKPQDDFCIVVDDKTAEDRTEDQLREMVLKVREVVEEYGFDLNRSGAWPDFEARIEPNLRRNLDDMDQVFEKVCDEQAELKEKLETWRKAIQEALEQESGPEAIRTLVWFSKQLETELAK